MRKTCKVIWCIEMETNLQIINQEADYGASRRILKERGLWFATYQQALVAIDSDLELKNKLKDKCFWIDGEGFWSQGYYTFDDKGKLTRGKRDLEKTVYVDGELSHPMWLKVLPDDEACAYEGRFYISTDLDSDLVASVIVGVGQLEDSTVKQLNGSEITIDGVRYRRVD